MIAPVDILRAARGILSDESRWTKGFFARLPDGRTCFPFNRRAACFCAFGALQRAAGYADPDVLLPSLAVEASALLNAPGGLAVFNDDPKTTHADVLALFDAAIARAGAT